MQAFTRVLLLGLLLGAGGCAGQRVDLSTIAESDLAQAVLKLDESREALDNVTVGDIKIIVSTAAAVRAGDLSAIRNLQDNERLAAVLTPLLSTVTNVPPDGDWLSLSAFHTLLNLDQWRDRLSWLPGIDSLDLDDILPGWSPPPIDSVTSTQALEVAAFLMDDAATRNMNGLAKSISHEEFTLMLDRQAAAGANTLWLYTSGIADGRNMPVSCYANGRISGPLDQAQVDDWHWKLAEARRRGLDIRLWFFADDSADNSRAPLDVQVAYVELIVREYGKYATRGYCIALEADEHLALDRVTALTAALTKLHSGSVGMHQLSGRTSWGASVPGVDVMIYQAGFGKSLDALVKEYRSKRGSVPDDRAFVMGEFHKSAESQESRAIGHAVIEAGADGSGGGAL